MSSEALPKAEEAKKTPSIPRPANVKIDKLSKEDKKSSLGNSLKALPPPPP
jgi:hypothetical protein